MDSEAVKELNLDLEELKGLYESSSRERNRALLQAEISNVEAQIKRKLEIEKKKKESTEVAPQICIVKIINYAWDQSDKFVKLYVTINGVQSLAPESVSTVFTSKTVELSVSGLENKNHVLRINNLAFRIKPNESYYKVKQDMVILFLKKDQPKHWACVTELEQKAKDMKAAATKPKDDDEDPSKSIMGLMKQMYDDGDDDMKRTIAKAWTEARQKQSDEPMF